MARKRGENKIIRRMGRRGLAKGPTPPTAPFDTRIDPSDNQAYTYDAVFAYYHRYYFAEEIAYYWSNRMTRVQPHSVGKFRVKATHASSTMPEGSAPRAADQEEVPQIHPDEVRLDPWMLPVTWTAFSTKHSAYPRHVLAKV